MASQALSSTAAHAQPPKRHYTRYIARSSDVLQDMRINVSPEGSDEVLWYKERYLGDEEIVEHVVHNPSSTIQWTIHRPMRGWYIRMRAPAFPPDVYIHFRPMPHSSPYRAEAALLFASRTNIPRRLPSPATPASQAKPDLPGPASGSFSYPPIPTIKLDPPTCDSPRDAQAGPSSSEGLRVSTGKATLPPVRRSPPPTQITEFILAPLSTHPVQAQRRAGSFFSRASSFLMGHAPLHTNSFSLSRVPSPTPPVPPIVPPGPTPTGASAPTANAPQQIPALLPPPPPLLNFHDRTPVFTAYAFTGLLEIDQEEELMLGVDTSFWIAVALTYLGFLGDRESYLAASSD